jgi:hypothetical protein
MRTRLVFKKSSYTNFLVTKPLLTPGIGFIVCTIHRQHYGYRFWNYTLTSCETSEVLWSSESTTLTRAKQDCKLFLMNAYDVKFDGEVRPRKV